MKLGLTDFSVFRPRRNEDELTLALLQLLSSQKKWQAEVLEKLVCQGPTLFTLTIEAEALEGNIKTKHTVQFVSSIDQLVL